MTYAQLKQALNHACRKGEVRDAITVRQGYVASNLGKVSYVRYHFVICNVRRVVGLDWRSKFRWQIFGNCMQSQL